MPTHLRNVNWGPQVKVFPSHFMPLHPWQIFPELLLPNWMFWSSNHLELLSWASKRKALALNAWNQGSSLSSARFANQFSVYLWQGRKGRVFANLCLSVFDFLAVGRCRLCSDCEQCSTGLKKPFFLAKCVVWKLAVAATAAIIAEFIAARSKWMSRRKSRRNRKCH